VNSGGCSSASPCSSPPRAQSGRRLRSSILYAHRADRPPSVCRACLVGPRDCRIIHWASRRYGIHDQQQRMSLGTYCSGPASVGVKSSLRLKKMIAKKGSEKDPQARTSPLSAHRSPRWRCDRARPKSRRVGSEHSSLACLPERGPDRGSHQPGQRTLQASRRRSVDGETEEPHTRAVHAA
jgi:hypothetical protein